MTDEVTNNVYNSIDEIQEKKHAHNTIVMSDLNAKVVANTSASPGKVRFHLKQITT